MHDPHGPVNSAGRRAGPCEGVCKLCGDGNGVNVSPAPVPTLRVFPERDRDAQLRCGKQRVHWGSRHGVRAAAELSHRRRRAGRRCFGAERTR